MRAAENDLATQLVEDNSGGGGGDGGTIASQLTNDAPTQAQQTAAAGTPSTPVPGIITPVTTPAATPAPVPVALSDGFFNKLTSALATAQGKVPMGPLRNVGRQAATAAGASPDVAEKVTIWLIPVVVVLAVAGTVYALRRRIFSHKVTA